MAVSVHSPACSFAAELQSHRRHPVINGSSNGDKRCILGASRQCRVGDDYYIISINSRYIYSNKKWENLIRRPACLASLYNSKSKRHWSTKSAPNLTTNRVIDSVNFSPIRFRNSDRFSGFAAMADPLNNGSTSLSSKPASLTTSNHLRHVESMATLPSGAGKIPRLNAVVLGEALASEEDDLVVPSRDFSDQALVSSPEKVCVFSIRLRF